MHYKCLLPKMQYTVFLARSITGDSSNHVVEAMGSVTSGAARDEVLRVS